MKTVLLCMAWYYVGVVGPIDWAPFVFIAMCVVGIARGWADMLEDEQQEKLNYVTLPLASARKRPP